MSQHLTEPQLPPTCVVVRQVAWNWVATLRHKRQLRHQIWCKCFTELVHCVTFWEVQGLAQKTELLTYLQDGTRYERLSYEQAHLLNQQAA